MNNTRWLLFSFSVPAKAQAVRVKALRRLHGLGAIPIKSALYLLPATPHHREQFTWLGREVEEGGGEVVIAASAEVVNLTPEQVRAVFVKAREQDYAALEADIRAFLGRPAGQDNEATAALRRLARRLDALRAIDFFPTGRAEALERLLSEAGRDREEPPPAVPPCRAGDFQDLLWVTREDPRVDRLASFWLVRRFVDPGARLGFVPADSPPPPGPGEVRFDMDRAEFTHLGGRITFEVLVEAFGLTGRIPARLRQTLRAVDLEEFDAAPAETLGVKRMLDGLAAAFPDGHARANQALPFFDALLASYQTPNQGA